MNALTEPVSGEPDFEPIRTTAVDRSCVRFKGLAQDQTVDPRDGSTLGRAKDRGLWSCVLDLQALHLKFPRFDYFARTLVL